MCPEWTIGFSIQISNIDKIMMLEEFVNDVCIYSIFCNENAKKRQNFTFDLAITANDCHIVL